MSVPYTFLRNCRDAVGEFWSELSQEPSLLLERDFLKPFTQNAGTSALGSLVLGRSLERGAGFGHGSARTALLGASISLGATVFDSGLSALRSPQNFGDAFWANLGADQWAGLTASGGVVANLGAMALLKRAGHLNMVSAGAAAAGVSLLMGGIQYAVQYASSGKIDKEWSAAAKDLLIGALSAGVSAGVGFGIGSVIEKTAIVPKRLQPLQGLVRVGLETLAGIGVDGVVSTVEWGARKSAGVVEPNQKILQFFAQNVGSGIVGNLAPRVLKSVVGPVKLNKDRGVTVSFEEGPTPSRYVHSEEKVLRGLSDPAPTIRKTAFIKSLAHNFDLVAREDPIYVEIKEVFDRVLIEARKQDPELQREPVDLILVDSPHFNAFANRALGVAIVDMTLVREMAKAGLGSKDHLACIISHELRHLSQTSEDGQIPVEQEVEADYYGMHYASRAGFNPLSAVDVMRFLRRHSAESGGISFLASHPKGFMRESYAVHVNAEPLSGQDQDYQSFSSALPISGAKRAFQREVASLTHYEPDSVLPLVHAARNLDELLLLTQKTKDLAVLAVARDLYQRMPWSQIWGDLDVSRLSDSTVQHFAVGWTAISILRTERFDMESDSFSRFRESFPGIPSGLQEQAVLRHVPARESQVLSVEDKIVLEEKRQTDCLSEEQLLQQLDAAHYWGQVKEKVPSLFLGRTLPLDRAAKVEVLHRMSWMALCYELSQSWSLFDSTNEEGARPWIPQEAPDLILQYAHPGAKGVLGEHESSYLEYRLDTARPLSAWISTHGPVARAFEARFRNLLASERGVEGRETQDALMTCYAGLIAGREFDPSSRMAERLALWRREYPELVDMADFVSGRMKGDVVRSRENFSMLEVLSLNNEFSVRNLDESIKGDLFRFHLEMNRRVNRAAHPFSVADIDLNDSSKSLSDEQWRGHCGKLKKNLSREIESLERSVSGLEEEAREVSPSDQDLAYIEERRQVLALHRECLQKVGQFETALPQLRDIASGDWMLDRVSPFDLEPLASRHSYLKGRGPIHSADWQYGVLFGYMNAHSDDFVHLDFPDLLGRLERAVAVDLIEELSRSDPLANHDNIARIVNGAGKGYKPRQDLYLDALWTKLQDEEGAPHFIDALVAFPPERAAEIWTGALAKLCSESSRALAAREKTIVLLQRFEERLEPHIQKRPDLYLVLLNALGEMKVEPNRLEAVSRVVRGEYETALAQVRAGTLPFEEFLKTHFRRWQSRVSAYKLMQFRDLEITPLLRMAWVCDYPTNLKAVYAYPTNMRGFHQEKYLQSLSPIPLDEIFSRARVAFRPETIRSIEAAFVTAVPDLEYRRAMMGRFLCPLVIGESRSFSSLDEAVIHCIKANSVALPEGYLKHAMALCAPQLKPIGLLRFARQLHLAIRSQTQQRAAYLLGRVPTTAECVEMASHWDPIGEHRWEPQVARSLSWLSELIVGGTRRGGYVGIDLAQLLATTEERRQAIAEGWDELDVERSLRPAYDPHVQDLSIRDSYPADHNSLYPSLLLRQFGESLWHAPADAGVLESMVAKFAQAIQPIGYRERYSFFGKPISSVSSKGKVELRVDDEVRALPEVEIEALYRQKLAERGMSDIFLEHSLYERQHDSFISAAAGLMDILRSKLSRFSEAEMSSARKIDLVLSAFPFASHERDALLIDLAGGAPALFREDWQHVAKVTGNLLTARRAERFGGSCFDSWLSHQNTDNLKAIGVERVVQILEACFPNACHMRDDAVDTLLNGSAGQKLDWVESISEFRSLNALKMDKAPKTRDQFEVPRDFTNGMFLLDWMENQTRDVKLDLFFWLIGKRDLPPAELMRASLSPRELGAVGARGSNFDIRQEILAYKGEHFETLKEIFQSSGRGVFVAQLMALLAGYQGLLVADDGYRPEQFLNPLIDRLGLSNLPHEWRELFMSVFEVKASRQAAEFLADILYRLREIKGTPTRSELLRIFVHAGGFEGAKFAQIAAQQSDLIRDPEIKYELSSFQSLPEAGRRDEAFFHLIEWAKRKEIPESNIRLGRLVARASAGQVYELTLTKAPGESRTYASKFVLQRNRYALEERIGELQSIVEGYRKRLSLDITVPTYLFDILRDESHLELSLSWEAQALEHLGGSLSRFLCRHRSVELRAPRVERDLSTNTVLLMEYVRGVPLKDILLDDTHSLRPILPDILTASRRKWFAQVGVEGWYHGDLHPGNILVGERVGDGMVPVYWIDAANSKFIDRRVAARNVVARKAIEDRHARVGIKSRAMWDALYRLYSGIPRQVFDRALEEAVSFYKADPQKLNDAHQNFVLALARESPNSLRQDLALVTSAVKASVVLGSEK